MNITFSEHLFYICLTGEEWLPYFSNRTNTSVTAGELSMTYDAKGSMFTREWTDDNIKLLMTI